MQFRETDEDRHFRNDVRQWLQANKPKDLRPDDSNFDRQLAYDCGWQRSQFDGGWAGIAWSPQYGGRGLSPSQQLIWCEEYARERCPAVLDSTWIGLNHAGPTLMIHGTQAQRSFHLPRILRGQESWCQGFSEPNAGSDLASLRTRGVVEGDSLVINGHKIWTTFAHLADYQELLVRTGPVESRHRALTWIICDMKAPGISIRPIKALDGHYHNCEVFYDNVRIPLSNVVGRINEGWSVVLTTLTLERGPAAFGGFCQMAVAFEELVALAKACPGTDGSRPAIDDQAIAQRIGILRAQLQSLHALMYVMVAAAQNGVELGTEGGLMHLPCTELSQAIGRLAVDILGMRSLSRTSSDVWVREYLRSFAATILGGTSEIHRNIIGERLLGLPR